MVKIIIEIIIALVALGLIPALIAKNKGRNFFKWWAYGAAIFIIALPHSLGLKLGEIGGRKKCQYCRTMVPMHAAHCPKCGYEFIDFS